jgi:alpha-tubulin suppressor-like RCC1 family protein
MVRNLNLFELDCLRVYSWGNNVLGQLGLGDKMSRTMPCLINDLSEKQSVVNVQCGAGHSFAIEANGSLYSWGASGDAQTGHGVAKDIIKPKKVSINNVKTIACGISHTAVIKQKA